MSSTAAIRVVRWATVAAATVWPTAGAPQAQQTAAAASPTFTRDIAPIITARSASCHREGGAAPFALTSFEDVSSRIDTVARVVERREMPPWLPAQGAETFAGARALSAAERDTIGRWIDQRAPRGEPVSNSAPPATAERERADLVVQAAEPYLLAANGPD